MLPLKGHCASWSGIFLAWSGGSGDAAGAFAHVWGGLSRAPGPPAPPGGRAGAHACAAPPRNIREKIDTQNTRMVVAWAARGTRPPPEPAPPCQAPPGVSWGACAVKGSTRRARARPRGPLSRARLRQTAAGPRGRGVWVCAWVCGDGGWGCGTDGLLPAPRLHARCVGRARSVLRFLRAREGPPLRHPKHAPRVRVRAQGGALDRWARQHLRVHGGQHAGLGRRRATARPRNGHVQPLRGLGGAGAQGRGQGARGGEGQVRPTPLPHPSRQGSPGHGKEEPPAPGGRHGGYILQGVRDGTQGQD